MEVLSHKMAEDKTILIEFSHNNDYGNLTVPFDISLEEEKFNVTTNITGYAVTGLYFDEEEITLQGETANIVDETPFGRKVNPTRVFWLIYKVSKRILCPECV